MDARAARAPDDGAALAPAERASAESSAPKASGFDLSTFPLHLFNDDCADYLRVSYRPPALPPEEPFVTPLLEMRRQLEALAAVRATHGYMPVPRVCHADARALLPTAHRQADELSLDADCACSDDASGAATAADAFAATLPGTAPAGAGEPLLRAVLVLKACAGADAAEVAEEAAVCACAALCDALPCLAQLEPLQQWRLVEPVVRSTAALMQRHSDSARVLHAAAVMLNDFVRHWRASADGAIEGLRAACPAGPYNASLGWCRRGFCEDMIRLHRRLPGLLAESLLLSAQVADALPYAEARLLKTVLSSQCPADAAVAARKSVAACFWRADVLNMIFGLQRRVPTPEFFNMLAALETDEESPDPMHAAGLLEALTAFLLDWQHGNDGNAGECLSASARLLHHLASGVESSDEAAGAVSALCDRLRVALSSVAVRRACGGSILSVVYRLVDNSVILLSKVEGSVSSMLTALDASHEPACGVEMLYGDDLYRLIFGAQLRAVLERFVGLTERELASPDAAARACAELLASISCLMLASKDAAWRGDDAALAAVKVRNLMARHEGVSAVVQPACCVLLALVHEATPAARMTSDTAIMEEMLNSTARAQAAKRDREEDRLQRMRVIAGNNFSALCLAARALRAAVRGGASDSDVSTVPLGESAPPPPEAVLFQRLFAFHAAQEASSSAAWRAARARILEAGAVEALHGLMQRAPSALLLGALTAMVKAEQEDKDEKETRVRQSVIDSGALQNAVSYIVERMRRMRTWHCPRRRWRCWGRSSLRRPSLGRCFPRPERWRRSAGCCALRRASPCGR